jgi:hypothetical protein
MNRVFRTLFFCEFRMESRARRYRTLIGKDGTVKLRSAEPVPVKDIFGLIDSMPMRRQEMDSGKK